VIDCCVLRRLRISRTTPMPARAAAARPAVHCDNVPVEEEAMGP